MEIQLSALSRQLSAGPIQDCMSIALPRNRRENPLQSSARRLW
jgi:hypothetical protein